MADGGWDDDDFEPADPLQATATATDKWEGEDEEEDVKDNWDDEDDDGKKAEGENGEVKAVQVKKKKPLGQRIAEKEAQKKAELEEKRRKEEEERKKMTPAEISAEKQRIKKVQEEADLALAVEAFGVNDSSAVQTGLDAMHPASREDFEEFEKALKDKITHYESSIHYVPFLEMLYRDLALSLEPEDIKKLGSTINALQNEKVKQQKGKAGKKKGKSKASVVQGKDNDYDDYTVGAYDEFDDFM